MLSTISTSEAIECINEYGRQRTPFLFVIDFLAEKPVVIPLSEVNNEELLYDFNGQTNYLTTNQKLLPQFQFNKHPLPFSDYQSKFGYVVNQIKLGNSFLTNLSVYTKVETDLDLKSIFAHSFAKYRLWWRDRFVCFSPEIFIQIDGLGKISSFPMKGTIDASFEDAENKILSDKKEFYEHTTIVDLIRNDISKVANKVWVEKFRYIDKIQTSEDKEILATNRREYGFCV